MPTYLIHLTVQPSPLRTRKTLVSPSAVVTLAMTSQGPWNETLGDGHTMSVIGNSNVTALTEPLANAASVAATACTQDCVENSGPHAIVLAAVADGIGVDGAGVFGLGELVKDGIGCGDGFGVQAPNSVTSHSASSGFTERAIRSDYRAMVEAIPSVALSVAGGYVTRRPEPFRGRHQWLRGRHQRG